MRTQRGRIGIRMLWSCGMLLALGVGAANASGRLVDLGEVSSAFVLARQVKVWLPPDYERDGSRRHAVLYMHDGQNLFEAKTAFGGKEWEVDETLGALIDEGSVRSTIVVGIWNTDARFVEYAPTKAVAALPQPLRRQLESTRGTPSADAYLHFLVDELKPLIDARFRTLPGPSQTFVAGSSMGGLISLYALVEYPQVFGGMAALSTHWPLFVDAKTYPPDALAQAALIAAHRQWLAQALPMPGMHRLYFDHGSEDLDAAYAPYQRAVDELLAAHGYGSGVNVTSIVFPGAGHNESAWRARLATPLCYLLGEGRPRGRCARALPQAAE